MVLKQRQVTLASFLTLLEHSDDGRRVAAVGASGDSALPDFLMLSKS